MRKPILFLTTAMAALATLPSVAHADHDSLLYRSADRYRDAVRHFEDQVRDADYFNRYDEKLVDRLEDAARDLRSAARHPEKIDRLLYAWEDVESLQPRVERAIFGRPCYPPNPPLMRRWDQVQVIHERLIREMHFVRQRPFCAAPEVCNGQCGYDSHYQPRGGAAPGVPLGPGGFGSRRDAPGPPQPLSPRDRDRLESQVRVRPSEPAGRERILATPPVGPRYSPQFSEREAYEAARRPQRRDLGATVVGSLVRRLLDD